MEGIKSVIDITKIQLNLKSEISFNDWLVSLSKISTVEIKQTPFFYQIKERTIKKLNPNASWEPIWQPQMTVQHPLQSTISLCNNLFPSGSMQSLIKQSTPTDISPDTALAGLLFLTAHEMVGMTNSYLIPLHQNYLLDLAMALTIHFSGQDITVPNLLQLSINALSVPELKELETHTLMRPYLSSIFEQDIIKQGELFSKLPMDDPFVQKAVLATANIGTFIPIVNDDKFMYKAILIRDTFESFSTVHQFDAKRWTNFMSRRPFSHMFKEIIKGEKNPIVTDELSISYLDKKGGFLKAFNNDISFAAQLPEGFHLANYAEQFYDKDNQSLKLEGLLDFFNPTIQGSIFLKNLLENGMVSTTMFSVMDLDKIVDNVTITEPAKLLIREMLKPEYSTIVLNSIEQPQERRILQIVKEEGIKIDAQKISGHDSILDLLSPPFLLDKSDSIGSYRKGIFNEEYASNTYGSAIVEFRNIQQAKQLKTTENKIAQSGFLTLPEYIEKEALNVFKLLSELTIPN